MFHFVEVQCQLCLNQGILKLISGRSNDRSVKLFEKEMTLKLKAYIDWRLTLNKI